VEVSLSRGLCCSGPGLSVGVPPRSSPGPRLPKPSGCQPLAAPGALLISPFNVRWRFSAPALAAILEFPLDWFFKQGPILTFPGLSLNRDPPESASRVTGTTGVCHHTHVHFIVLQNLLPAFFGGLLWIGLHSIGHTKFFLFLPVS
jgi:hypothetical protein